MGVFMRYYFIVPLIAFLLSIVSPVLAETVTFTKEYTYQASDFDSRNSSRTLALEMVKRLLLEELGTYLVSETEVKNMQLTKDQVTTYSAGIVGAEIIDEKWDGKSYWLKAKVSADPKEVEKALTKLVKDKSKTQELEETRKKTEELTKENERLRRELEAGAKANKPDKEAEAKNVRAYENTIRGLNATEWYKKGLEAYGPIRRLEAIEAYNKAIELNPDMARAYLERGNAHLARGNYEQAIKDLSKAIELKINYKPDYALAYVYRGAAYENSGNLKQAIKDYSKAIEVTPGKADFYNARGFAYSKLGNYQRAIKDYSKAIKLTSDVVERQIAYYFRGLAYIKISNHQHAIADFKIAARLGDENSQEFLKGEGLGW